MDLTIVTLVEMMKNTYRFYAGIFHKINITIVEVALHMKYIDIEIVYLTRCGKLRRI